MPEMKLWLLQRIGETDYDQSAGFVVRAEDEAGARCEAMADGSSGGGRGWVGEPEWGDPQLTTCVELSRDGEPSVILTDFRAG